MALSEYEQQMLRLKQWNKTIMLGTVGLVIVLMFFIVGLWFWMQHRTAQKLEGVQAALVEQQADHKKTTDENLRLNKAQVCILNIPAMQRSTNDIEHCMTKFKAYVDLDLNGIELNEQR